MGYSKAGALVSIIPLIALATSAHAGGHSFGGLDCQFQCAEHAAGYVWAESQRILDPNFCPAPTYNDFHEGCLVYTGNPFRGSEKTDDALPIKGVAGALLKMRFLLRSSKAGR